MPKFLTYRGYDDFDTVKVIPKDKWDEMTESEKETIYADIEEYVWQETDSKETAIARYDACYDEWADDQENDSEKYY